MNFADLLQPGGSARALKARYRLEELLASPGSITGHQTRLLELGLSGKPADGGRINGQERLRADLGDLLLLCKDLNETEESCCRLRYGCAAGVLSYTEVRRLCDLREGDGEDVIDVRPKDYDSKPIEGGYVRVRGRRARYPEYSEIGAALGLTAHQVRNTLNHARSKIDKAIRWRAFAACMEASYE